MRGPGDVLLVSCYELGHQPVAVATAAAFLAKSGFAPRTIDLAVECLDVLGARPARFVCVSVPMHTALRVAVRAAPAIRAGNPGAHVCFFGLYATLNAEYLLGEGIADSVLGGELEASLVALAEALASGAPIEHRNGVVLSKIPLVPPRRSGLPALGRYAKLEVEGGTRVAAAVEASRGCLHLCRHCPIPPVYGGKLFIVPRDVVLDDIRAVVAAGAAHVTFADPDFLNGPRHALEVVRALDREHPSVTFDFTAKIEHVRRHRALLPEMAERGCLFVVSAVESLSDAVLASLEKGHTREDVFEALDLLRASSIWLRPSLLPFTPWSTISDYADLLDWIEDEDLVGQVDPVQLAIRLLVPPGSILASHPSMTPHLGALERENFSYAWAHPDPRMDRLYANASAIVHAGALAGDPPERVFARLREAAIAASEGSLLPRESRFLPARASVRPPRLTEPWFC